MKSYDHDGEKMSNGDISGGVRGSPVQYNIELVSPNLLKFTAGSQVDVANSKLERHAVTREN